MNSRNSKSYIFFLISLLFISALPLKDAGADEETWKLMGRTKDGNFFVYYSPEGVNYHSETYVRLKLKRERTPEGIEQFEMDFKASLKEAEDKAGGRLRDDHGPLMNMLLNRERRVFTADIDCVSNELRVLPEQMSGFNIVRVYEIEPGIAIENIRNEVCKKP